MATRPRTIEEIFVDYRARRTALIHALTRDVDEVFNLCDSDKENLCLYGHSDETWEVTQPTKEVQRDIPEPVIGINFDRKNLNFIDWLYLVALFSESWLFSVAFYYGYLLNKNERERLFSLINDLPTIPEVLAGWIQVENKPILDSGSNSPQSTEGSSDGQNVTHSLSKLSIKHNEAGKQPEEGMTIH
ncbi:PHD finger protein ALFIN-LIKE 2-like [Cajanus cajan]|uniref:PHD finger protein ALFIN-LIKE 2-like n=1 Tax=Cajanus cajan TaxID=3821 RepID=UPI0010FACF1F|nr:PHD finger protein ALFIN-LIKE 2-like [Cajanus cajan]